MSGTIPSHSRINEQPKARFSQKTKIAEQKQLGQEAAPHLAEDNVEISGTGPTSEPRAGEIKDLIPISITLQVPAAALGGVFKSLPVLLTKEQAENPNWKPEPGTPIPFAPVIDANFTTDAPKGKIPVGMPVEDVPRHQLPEEKRHYPLVMSEGDRAIPERTWHEALQDVVSGTKSIKNENIYLNLTLGVDQEGFEALGNQSVAFAPRGRVSPESRTWKESSEPFIHPKFLQATMLDEDGDENIIPRVEYLFADEQLMNTDHALALADARRTRPTHAATVDTEWGGEQVSFDVQLTERLQNSLAKTEGADFDPRTGRLTVERPGGRPVVQNLSLSQAYEKQLGKEMPPWLLHTPDGKNLALPKNRVLVDLDPETRKLNVDCPDGYNFQGAVVPESGKVYKTQVPGADGLSEIEVKFGERAAKVFAMMGLTFAKDQALLYLPDGEKLPLDSRRHDELSPETLLLRQLSNQRPLLTSEHPPWLYETLSTNREALYGVPEFGVQIDVNDQGMPVVHRLGPNGRPATSAEEDGAHLSMPYKTFRSRREKRVREILGDSADFKGGSGIHTPLTQHRVNDNLVVNSATKESAEEVEKLSKLFLGIDRDQDRVDVEKLQQFRDKINDDVDYKDANTLLTSISATLAKEEVRKEMAELAGLQWEGQDANLLGTEIKRALKRNSPVEITVVPKGADFRTYLTDQEKMAAAGQKREMAAFVLQPQVELLDDVRDVKPTKIFVGEELLESPERRVVVAHELLHAFKEVYASDEELNTIEQSHAESINKDKEFPSLYGALSEEFLPTLGEEFLGLHGEDGAAWVKKEHPAMYGLLKGLTGLDPAKDGPVKL